MRSTAIALTGDLEDSGPGVGRPGMTVRVDMSGSDHAGVMITALPPAIALLVGDSAGVGRLELCVMLKRAPTPHH